LTKKKKKNSSLGLTILLGLTFVKLRCSQQRERESTILAIEVLAREEEEFMFFEVLPYKSFYLIDIIVMWNVKDKV
jgi:hypothetical protein